MPASSGGCACENRVVRIAKRTGLRDLLPHYVAQPLTYSEVGATARALPEGYAHTRRRSVIGHGENVFADASRLLMTWEMHRRSGLVLAADGDAHAGSTVVLGLGRSLLLVVPCRVVYTVDEPGRCGFAYGTLPDHPEQGEEAFLVTRDPDDTVSLEIVAFSRPGAALVRLVSPVARAIQAAATSRYERALAKAVL